MMAADGVEEVEEKGREPDEQPPPNAKKKSTEAAHKEEEGEPSESKLRQYGGFLYSYLPGLPTFFQSKPSATVSKVQASPKKIDKAKLEEQYSARLEAYLELRRQLVHIETTYNEQRTSSFWQTEERKLMIDLIRTVAMTLPTETTFDSKDKEQGIKEIAVSHAILLGLCAYVSMRIHNKEYKAEGKGLFKKAVSLVHSNPTFSTLYTLLDVKIKPYSATAKADCMGELYKFLQKTDEEARIAYPDKLKKRGTLEDIKTYQTRLLNEAREDAALSYANT